MATGSDFPTTLDTFSDLAMDDFVYPADYNKQSSAIEKIEAVAVTHINTALILLKAKTASNQATLDFTTADFIGGVSLYDEYLITFTEVNPATDNVSLAARVSQSATFASGGTDYAYAGIYNTTGASTPTGSVSSGASAITFSGPNLDAAAGLCGEFRIHKMAGTAATKKIYWRIGYFADGGAFVNMRGTGIFKANNSAIDGIRFLHSSGNISSGDFKLYGVKKS